MKELKLIVCMVAMMIMSAVSNQAYAFTESESLKVADEMVKTFNNKEFKQSITQSGIFTDLKAYRIQHTINVTLVTNKKNDIKNLSASEKNQLVNTLRDQIILSVRSDASACAMLKDAKINLAITIKSPSGKKATSVIKYSDL